MVVSEAAALARGRRAANVKDSDDDWFAVPNPTVSGSCSISYTAAAGSRQDLRVRVYDEAQNQLDDQDAERTGATETITVTWTADTARFLRINASTADCQAYELNCN